MQKSNGFETGTNGNPMTGVEPGDPDSFNAISGIPPDYSNEHPNSGVLGVKYTALTSAQHYDWTGLGTVTGNMWGRIYLYLTALPSDNNFYPINFRTVANTSGAALRVLATGIIQMRDSTNSQIGGDGSIAVATNQMVRLEVRQNTGAGEFEYWLYNTATSSTATESQSVSGASLGADTGRINFGHNVAGVAAGLTSWWDDAAVSDVAKIGPVSVAAGAINRFRVRRSRATSW